MEYSVDRWHGEPYLHLICLNNSDAQFLINRIRNNTSLLVKLTDNEITIKSRHANVENKNLIELKFKDELEVSEFVDCTNIYVDTIDNLNNVIIPCKEEICIMFHAKYFRERKGLEINLPKAFNEGGSHIEAEIRTINSYIDRIIIKNLNEGWETVWNNFKLEVNKFTLWSSAEIENNREKILKHKKCCMDQLKLSIEIGLRNGMKIEEVEAEWKSIKIPEYKAGVTIEDLIYFTDRDGNPIEMTKTSQLILDMKEQHDARCAECKLRKSGQYKF